MPGLCGCALTTRRMSAFVRCPDGSVLPGRRRLDRNALMEDVADAAELSFPGSKAIKIKEAPRKGCPRVLATRDVDRITIHSVMDHPGWEEDIGSAAKGIARVFCGQDLCRQVPACFRKISK